MPSKEVWTFWLDMGASISLLPRESVPRLCSPRVARPSRRRFERRAPTPPDRLAAMRLIVTAFMTLDGIIEAPGFDEHRFGRNAWALRVQGDDDEVFNKAQIMSADALLLGRRTWQIWAAFWPTMQGGDTEMTERMNAIPKF